MAKEIRAETVAGLVKGLRAALRLTQREMAEEVERDRGLIARLENGRDAEIGTVRRVLAAFGGRLELAARFESPLEALADSFVAARWDHWRERQDARQRRFLARRAGQAIR